MALFNDIRHETLKDENKELIAEYLKTKSIQQCPPSGVRGNEASRATHEFIMKERAQFRKDARAEKKRIKANVASSKLAQLKQELGK